MLNEQRLLYCIDIAYLPARVMQECNTDMTAVPRRIRYMLSNGMKVPAIWSTRRDARNRQEASMSAHSWLLRRSPTQTEPLQESSASSL